MKENKQKVIIIAGVTGVGKTATGVFLSKKLGGEVISADSIQVYKGFDIGSAKVTKEEMQGVTHHLIDIKNPHEEYSAGEFARQAEEKVIDINNRGKIAIIVGGTGLYISSFLFPLSSNCERDEEFRLQMLNKSNQELYDMLLKIDPKSAESINIKQTDRIVRALEIYHLTGKKKSELTRDFSSKYDYLLLFLNRDRQEVYDVINKRVDKMFESGLIEEIKGILNQGVDKDAPAFKGIGYREVLGYLNGNLSFEECSELIKKNTRNYAKRQITYFKKLPNIEVVDYQDRELILQKVENFLK